MKVKENNKDLNILAKLYESWIINLEKVISKN